MSTGREERDISASSPNKERAIDTFRCFSHVLLAFGVDMGVGLTEEGF
jgi:hypothetical protein